MQTRLGEELGPGYLYPCMIRRFEPTAIFHPVRQGRFQIVAALGAGLIAGLILLVMPRGNPWSGISFFSNVIMGRAVPMGVALPLAAVCLVHLVLAEAYAVIISAFVNHTTQVGAIIAGAVIGLVLYLVNTGIVAVALPEWRGNEVGVLFTHAVFGLLVGGAYRGLLKRNQEQPAGS